MDIITPTIEAHGIIARDPYLRPADATRPAYASIRLIEDVRRRDANGQWNTIGQEAVDVKATGRTAELIATLVQSGAIAKGTKLFATGTPANPDTYMTKDGHPAATMTIFADRIGIDLLRQAAADQAKARRQQQAPAQARPTRTPAAAEPAGWTSDAYQAPASGWPNEQV